MTKKVSNERLAELIRKEMPPALHPLGHDGDCLSCDLVLALQELQQRRAAEPTPRLKTEFGVGRLGNTYETVSAEPPHNQLGLTRGEMAEAQRKALGEPEADQPRAWMDAAGFISSVPGGGYDIPLYPRPAPRTDEPPEKPTKWYCCVCYAGFTDETEMLNHKSKSPECFCGPCNPLAAVGLPTRTSGDF